MQKELDLSMLKQRISELAELAGFQLKAIAECAGITYPILWKSLSGQRKFKPEELVAIAEKLETTVDYLLGQTDDPRPPAQQPIEAAKTEDDNPSPSLKAKMTIAPKLTGDLTVGSHGEASQQNIIFEMSNGNRKVRFELEKDAPEERIDMMLKKALMVIKENDD